jgi:hypothetical protein
MQRCDIFEVLTLECFLPRVDAAGGRIRRGGTMDPKLAMLFMLIGGIVVLARLSEQPRPRRLRRSWRLPVWKRS